MPTPQPLPGVNSIVAVGSGKGGVGKTTLAVNLAIALQRMGHKVGLLDADVYGPNVPLMLATSEQPKVMGEGRIEPLIVQGLKVISVGFLNPGDKPLIWRGPMLHSIIRQFLGSVEWGQLDYLVVDLPPGTGDVALSLIQTVPLTGAIVVALGNHISGIFSNDDGLAEALVDAGKRADDRAWHMPIGDEYGEQLKSNFADFANVAGREGGAITAACYLAKFTKDLKWAHLDVAGTAYQSGAQKSSTGRPVPLLVEYLLSQKS